MTRRISFLLLIVGVFLSCTARAYEFEKARADMAQDLMSCMTYYNYLAKTDQASGRDSSTMDYNARWALRLAQTYLPEMKRLAAMSDLSAKVINKILKEEGPERLVLSYAESCKSILEHPTDRMQYWLDKK